MPRLIEAEIGNLLPGRMVFAMPAASREIPTIVRLDDGSLVMDAVPLIGDIDMLYYGYELPIDELFGESWDTNWEHEYIGRMTLEAAELTCDQFEGLPITDGHVDVETGRRTDVAVGTFLRDATMDGPKVRSRALIYEAAAVLKVETNQNELSIGGIAFLEPNPARGGKGEPDFFIKRVNLNHVALVKNGRAGPEARLLNHKAELANKPKEVPLMKITINGVEVDVPDMVANHYSAQIANTEARATAAEAALAAAEAARDTAQGRADGLATELANAQAALAAKPDANTEAVRIANEHASFVAEATRLGYTGELVLGAYDATAIMTSVLNARGSTVPADASADYMRARWDAALEVAGNGTTSVLDNALPKNGLSKDTPFVSTDTKVNNSYFGGVKKDAQA